jgi:sugar phosphate isomerase/epimerase
MFYSRRDLGKIALATLPLASAVRAFGAVNSKFNGVQIGVQTYSFRELPDPAHQDIPTMVAIGLGEAELMSEHAETLAGAPAQAGGGFPGGGRRGGQVTQEQRDAMQAARTARAAEMAKWRASISLDKFKDVRKQFDDAGLQLALLCYNMNEQTTDDEIEYGFQMAKALGVQAITTSTQVTVSKRVAPFADKHKMMVGFHGHDATDRPNEFSSPETFATAMSYSKYHGVNLDIGHFTAANFDAIAYIKEHHERITNLHIKDRKKDHGPNMSFGEGDTPIKEVLRLVAKEKYPFPANIEFEYRVPEGSDVKTEVAKCLKYCKDALA